MGKKRHWLARWAGTLVVLVLILSFFIGGLTLFWMTTLEIPDFNSFHDRIITESTKIYDRTGKVLLYDVHGMIRRKVVTLDEISQPLKDATIAIEDKGFYQHHGVKPSAMLRAFLVDLITGSLKQGGSTITQQVVKNTILTQERKITRKIKEIVLALKMEQSLTKDQILTLYLNETPYGGSIYGVEEAAQSFFGKPAKEVNLAEAAYIAAIANAPSYYSPYGQHLEQLEKRKNFVLKQMQESGKITAAEEKETKDIKVTFQNQNDGGIKAPHFVIFIKNYLEEKYGAEAVATRGFKVITSLDWDLQQAAERIVAEYGAQNEKNFNAKNAALVAIDPKTGQILALVGSRDYFDVANEGNFNVALAHRQPGSSFKPFVYATALNQGFTPETAIFDVPTQFDTNCADDPSRCYTPSNYDDKFRGPMVFRTALAQSINIPAIKVLYLAGIKNAITLAKNMGIESLGDPNRYGLTLVLGGGEVSLLDLTSAYSVFANDGVRNPKTAIIRIEDSQGKILEEFTPHAQEVLRSNVARQISDILSDNQARQPSYSADSPLYFPGRQVAAKTGTSNDYRDAWILGYTPSIAVGAWVGNNDNSPMEKKVAGFIVAPLWHAFMAEALKKLPPEEKFTAPEKISPSLQPIYRGFWQGNQNYFIDKITGKSATEYTPESQREERVVQEIHSILYWLERGNDSQFKLWEEPVRAWAIQNGYRDQKAAEVIPSVTDDVHLPKFQPTFTLVSPDPKQTYPATKFLTITIGDYRGHFPLAKVEAFLNDQYLGSTKQPPFSINFSPEDLLDLQKENKLRVIVYDSVDNQSEEIVNLSLVLNN